MLIFIFNQINDVIFSDLEESFEPPPKKRAVDHLNDQSMNVYQLDKQHSKFIIYRISLKHKTKICKLGYA